MAEQPFLSALSERKVLLADGAMGTELLACRLRENCPEAYNLSRPDVVQAIHAVYLTAGADIIETNTFGANRARLVLYGEAELLAELNRAAAALAADVRREGKFIAGAIGPTGQTLEPYGAMSAEEAFAIFAEQAEILAEAGVDVIFIETMTALSEARAALDAVKKRTNLPVSVSLSFEVKPVGVRTAWGDCVEKAAISLADGGADIIGANCGLGFQNMAAIAEEICSCSRLPVIIQPNAGLPDSLGRYSATPRSMEQFAEHMLRLGVSIIGGCCGTKPAHTRMMRRVTDRHLAGAPSFPGPW